MPYKIQGNYDELAQMARRFTSEAASTQDMMQQVAQVVGNLENGGWVGAGAQAFFVEMRELVFPGVQRLIVALNDASSATNRIVIIFSQAENDAAKLFGGGADGADGKPGLPSGASEAIDKAVQQGILSPEAGKWIKNIWTVLSKSTTLLKAMGKIPKSFIPGAWMPMIGGVISGGVDWLTGKENFLNGMGKGLMSGGIDYGLGVATGGVYSIVIAASDLSSLAGQGAVWMERGAFDMMSHMDQGVRDTLNAGLDHANQVFQGIRISDTVGSLKNLVWDVGFRPAANAISNGFSTGNPLEVLRGAGMLANNMSPLGAFNMASNFLNDSNAVKNALQHSGELITNAGNLVLSLPQASNEAFRMPLRFGAGLFSQAVYYIPSDAATHAALTNMSRDFANYANSAVMPFNPMNTLDPTGMLGLGCEKIQPYFNQAAQQVSGFLNSLN